MNIFGLIGHPLSHSFSKQYFDNKFKEEQIVDVSFELYDIENIAALKSILEDKSVKGLAVTIPYKQEVISFLNEADGVTKQINACNCIRIKDGKLFGFNTDVIGFEKSFIKDLKPNHTKALVLGNGGASAAVKFVLNKLQIDYQIVTRTKQENTITYFDLNEAVIESHHLIINTTPVGTYPNIRDYVDIPYQHLTSQHYLFDLVYNPSLTAFMQKGLHKNAFVKNGYEMLAIQAEQNWKIWNEIN